MKKHWWKILAVLLLLYVLLAGLLIRIGPGIASLNPITAEKGDLTLTISGYNTRFTEAASSLQVWIESGDASICADSIKIISDHLVTASFNIPEKFPTVADIFVNSDADGTFGIENGISFTHAGASEKSAPPSCKVTIRNEKADFINYPNREILYETIRNLFFHVPMWFAMLIVLTISLVYSIKYLRTSNIDHDIIAAEMANSGILLGILGVATGSFWARHTWLDWWVNDPQLNGAAIAMLIYFAYVVLRGSIDDEQKRGRIAAVYSIFAYVMLLVFVGIYPKVSPSLHPTSGGNTSFRDYDMDSTMRMVFYPAVIGFALLAIWMASIKIRLRKIYRKVLFNV
jgi:heme exporter protein C